LNGKLVGSHRQVKSWLGLNKSSPARELEEPHLTRRVTRWEHQAVIDVLQARMALAPQAMRTRRGLVEHPFGTIKA